MTHTRGQPRPAQARLRDQSRRTPAVGGALVLLAGVATLSLLVGARAISPLVVWEALAGSRTTSEHVLVAELRVPRTIVGLAIGPALGLCGALMQAFTRNPLADPGLLGVNAGASFVVTFAVGVLGVTAPGQYVWFALLGALGATIGVYALGSVGAAPTTPLKLVLSGIALGAVLNGFSSAIVLKSDQTLDVTRFWGVGSLGGRSLDALWLCSPLLIAGVLLGAGSARSLNALALGDDVAVSLGVRIARTRAVVVVAVTLLAGTSVAIAGPIGFVGLMVPHIVRWLVGPDQRWIVALAVVVSPIVLLTSDIVGRVVLPSGELRVGLVTAIIGAPLLIALVRRHGATGL